MSHPRRCISAWTCGPVIPSLKRLSRMRQAGTAGRPARKKSSASENVRTLNPWDTRSRSIPRRVEWSSSSTRTTWSPSVIPPFGLDDFGETSPTPSRPEVSLNSGGRAGERERNFAAEGFNDREPSTTASNLTMIPSYNAPATGLAERWNRGSRRLPRHRHGGQLKDTSI